MTKRPDRRGPRTRRLLRDALISLILEKGYDAVTVQDITDRANLGRATFYLHFKNGKDQLLMNSLREMFDDLKGRITPPTTDIPLGDMALRMIPFQHAFEYRDLYRVTLLSQQGTAAIVNGIREYLAGSLRERIDVAIGEHQPLVPLDVLANYLAGAMISLISWWLKQESNYTAEQMADMFRQLSMPTISTVLGLSSPSG